MIIKEEANKLTSAEQKAKIKNVLIHTDHKFVHGTKRFEGDNFENTIVILKKKLYNGSYKKEAKFYNSDEIDEVVELCKEADLVVLYDLDLPKSKIALALPDDIRIAWRFFGYELYGRMERTVLSDKTWASKAEPKETIKDFLRLIYYKIEFYRKLRYRKSLEEIFYNAIDRIDYMLVINKKEYEFLSKHFENLPECIRLPLHKEDISGGSLNIKRKRESKKIVLGNSRTVFNNHLDVIEKIEQTKNKRDYNFLLPFNYGPDGHYAEAVRKAVKGKAHYSLIEEFIPKETFSDFYADVDALIINSYRQMAMGNILLALNSGVKVYLSKKNVIMDSLLSEGIEVFPIADLMVDIDEGNIRLDEKTAYNNLERLNNVYLNYTEKEFQEIIYREISKDLSIA
jgi:dTDP-N-acetylfucosamine:lipid II N-acetylfucosaminyltransferase